MYLSFIFEGISVNKNKNSEQWECQINRISQQQSTQMQLQLKILDS